MTENDPAAVVETYVAALRASDLARMLALFEPDGQVVSPLRGETPAGRFYAELFADTSSSDVRTLSLHFDPDRHAAAAELDYDWTLSDGAQVRFRCVDVFRFSPNGRIRELRIYYDASRVRPTYEAVRPPRRPEPAAHS